MNSLNQRFYSLLTTFSQIFINTYKEKPKAIRSSWIFLLLPMMMLSSNSVFASHFRGGAISWQSQDLDNDGSVDDVVITTKTAWRRDFVGNVSLTFSPSVSTATEVSESLVFVGGAETVSDSDYALQTTVFEVYNLSVGTEYIASFNGAARISTLENNSNGNWSIQTKIQLDDGNQAPSLEFPIIYEVPQKNPDGSVLIDWTFDVDALDQNTDSVRYRLANNAELGGGSSVNADGLSIDTTSGLITWSGSGNRSIGVYSGGIVAEDLDSAGNVLSMSHVDFLLDLRDASELDLTPPTQLSDSRNENVEKGTQSSFSFDGESISVVALGDAQGALVETSPNNFTFTPGPLGSPLDPGVYPITFEINDSADAFTNSYYSINFIVPNPDAPLVANLQDDRTPYFQPGSIVSIDNEQNALVSDSTNQHFSGGSLRLNLSNSDYANETLAINTQGTGPDEISVTGSSVSYQGSPIGTINSTLNGVNNILAIDFTSTDATLEAVTSLIRQLTYTNSAEAVDRDLSLHLEDTEGNSNFYSMYLQAVSFNHSTVSATPNLVSADGAAETTITVSLLDNSARALRSSGGIVTVASTIGTPSLVIDNADGTYTSTLTSITEGIATITATANGGAISNTSQVSFIEPVAPASSTVTLSSASAAVDTNTTITVQAVNANGGNVPVGGDAVIVSTTAGSLSSVTDNNNGSYTATITSSATGTSTISASINGSPANNTQDIVFTAGDADATSSSISANSTTPTTDETVSITVQLRDSNGNTLSTGGNTVVFNSTQGIISSATDVGDGTYTANLMHTTPGAAVVSASVNSTTLSDSLTITFSTGAAAATSTTLSVSQSQATTDDSVSIVLQSKDASGNNLTAGGDNVVFNTSLGAIGSTVDNNNGTYTALLSNPSSGIASISATINGTIINDTESVNFTPGIASAQTSTFSFDNLTPTTDGTVTITLQAVDGNGNSKTTGGDTVSFMSEVGTISTTTDNGDGTYSATLTVTNTATTVINAVINGATVVDSQSISFLPGAADPDTSLISISNTSPTTDESVGISLQAIDANGNYLTTGGYAFTLTSSAGSLTATLDNNDGTYSATLTNTTAGTITIGATLSSSKINDTISLIFSPGTATAELSTFTISDATPTTAQSVTVTIDTIDASGNSISRGGDTVDFSSTIGTVSSVVDHADGTYSAILTSTVAESGTVDYTLNNRVANRPIDIEFMPGDFDVETSKLLVADSELTTENTTAVKLQLKDQFGNELTTGGLDVQFSTNLGLFIEPVSDNSDGSYQAIFKSAVVGTAQIRATVNTATISSFINVSVSPSEAAPFRTSVATVPNSLEANGTNVSTVTIRLMDDSGNFLIQGGDTIVLETDWGTVSSVLDNNDGTYTATYKAPDKIGQKSTSATVVISVNGVSASPANITLLLSQAGDEDGDGIPNIFEGTTRDSDNDGTPDYLDSDSDNDGVPDNLETQLPPLTGIDSDEDGIDDALDVDSTSGKDDNGNNIDDRYELLDTDNDSVPDYLDIDSDNDGIPDRIESSSDSDEDGLPDYRDEDSNNDGINDTFSASLSGIDTDQDGIFDEFDVDNTGGTDENNDGIDDLALLSDMDGDGFPDYQDNDIDGDGVLNTNDIFPQDSLESFDADGDGQGDNADVDDDNDGYTDEVEAVNGTSSTDNESLPAAVDTDGDLIADSLERGYDSDGDGIEDYLEVDSDNDGIYDHIEASEDTTSARLYDVDGDGRIDISPTGVQQTLLYTAVDTDGDGIFDYRDLDSDNDGIKDSIEAAPNRNDALLNDGVDTLLADTTQTAQQSLYWDIDNDAIENFRDLDSDNDDIADLVEGGGIDRDNDGRQDDFVDNDQNGYSDTLVTSPLAIQDTDSDGLQDFIDLDSDQDGLPDLIETSGTDNDRNGRVDSFIDLDGDGWTDIRTNESAVLRDTDSDGTLDYLDLDSDNDGIFDLIESGKSDDNGDGRVDKIDDSDADGIPDDVDIDSTGGNDADNDGIDDRFDTTYSEYPDTDGDGIIDEFDDDANGDGIADENSGSNYVLGAALPDSDKDGIPDIVDQSEDRLRIGLTGSGCSIASTEGFDPILLLLALSSILYLFGAKRDHQRPFVKLMTFTVALFISVTTHAHADTKNGVYAGIGASTTTLEPELEGNTFTIESNSSAGWQAYLGYRFRERIRAELTFAELGNATLSPSASLNYQDKNISVLFDFWNGNYLNKNRINLFGKLGIGSLTGNSELNIVTDSTAQILFGLGVDLQLSKQVSVRADAVSYDEDASRMGLSIMYKFGNAYVSAASDTDNITTSSASALVFEPTVKITPYKQTQTKENTSDSAKQTLLQLKFSTDSSSLNKASTALLRSYLKEINATEGQWIVTGHTDDTGSYQHNQKLSEDRGESVRNYLIQQGINNNNIEVTGLGELEPLADNSIETGRTANRRAEVIFTQTK